MDPEVQKILEEHEARIKELEKIVSGKPKIEQDNTPSKKLKGIPGGIQELIDNRFFSTPKSVNEARDELERKGFFANIQRIDVVIRRDFFKRKGILTRVKDNKSWKYVTQK